MSNFGRFPFRRTVYLITIILISFTAGDGFARALPTGTLPMFVEDPVLPSDPQGPTGFACYGACGASCDCVDKAESRAVTCQNGEKCSWPVTTCKTHSFCRWHDSCYRACDFTFPGK